MAYLKPLIVRRQIQWPHQCEAQVQTPEVLQWRTRHEKGPRCVHRAKVDFRGMKVCFMHAKQLALFELAGPEPTIEFGSVEK